MDSKFTTLLLVIIIGILVGVGIVAKQNEQAKAPVLGEILASQKRIEQNTANNQGQDMQRLLVRLGGLEGRLAKLEKEVKANKNAPAPTPPARPQPPAEDYTKKYEIPVDHSILVGAKNGSVTITEFVDFECPFCARFHGPIEQVLDAYPKDVNYMVKNFPLSFHPNAAPASKAAFAAGEQGKYREMVNLLLQNGRNLNPATYERLAKDIGLNVKKFKKDMAENDAKYQEYIRKDMALGSKVGVRGTPTFYINGVKTRSRDLNGFKREIDAILKK